MNICEKDIVRAPSIPHFKGLDMRNYVAFILTLSRSNKTILVEKLK